MTGQVFGRLTVLHRVPSKGVVARWRCACTCGVALDIAGSSLRLGKTVSCGCYSRDRSTRHGAAGKPNPARTAVIGRDPLYAVWSAMLQRTTNPNDKGFKNYGGRGIGVCARWRDFAAFRDDMGARPDGLTLERRDNNGDYEPDNCYWADRFVQNNNTRRNAVNRVAA